MNLTVLTGHEALAWARREDEQSKWKALLECCPWATAFQHPDFVAPWYEHYQSVVVPVIVCAVDGDGSLAGLLPLAWRRNGAKLTGAGEQQAEYHGWIQGPGMASDFIVSAIGAVRERFPGVDISLRYLAPGIPLQWTGAQSSFGKLCALRVHRRPLMKIDANAMARQRNKKNHRQNYNRLRRSGEVGFERIIEHDRFISVFDEICSQYDFRQAALYHNMPFKNDPFKKPFYLALHKRGLLHATILRVGESIAASHVGVVSQQRALHLGINTYDPALAAHSPGNLLLAMLGVHLAEENVDLLDLTPGGDAYKEHFATEHDTVSELTIYGNAERRLKTEALLSIMSIAKNRLRKAGYRTADVVAAIEKAKHFRSQGLPRLWGALRPRRAASLCEYRYRGHAEAVAANTLPICRNRLEDIFKFDAQGSSARYCEFLGLVMKRMERSHHLFTLVQNDTLQIYCWVALASAAPPAAAASHIAAPSGDSFVISDLYVHPRLDNIRVVKDFMENLLFELNAMKADAQVYYRGMLNAELPAVLEQCGFAGEAR